MTFRQHNILGLCTRKAGQALVPHSIPQPQSLSHMVLYWASQLKRTDYRETVHFVVKSVYLIKRKTILEEFLHDMFTHQQPTTHNSYITR